MEKAQIDSYFLFDSFFIKKNASMFLEQLAFLIRINNKFLPKNRHNLISSKSFQSLNADDERSAVLTRAAIHPINETETEKIEEEENEVLRTLAYARYYSRSDGGKKVIIFSSLKDDYEQKIKNDAFIRIINDPIEFKNKVTDEYKKTRDFN